MYEELSVIVEWQVLV